MLGVYGPEREWLIENHGLEPDIVVENPPHTTFSGEDAQLNAAVRYLLDKIAEDPRAVPEPPPFPDKSFHHPATTTSGQGGGAIGLGRPLLNPRSADPLACRPHPVVHQSGMRDRA